MSAGVVADRRLGGKGSESQQRVTLEQRSAGWPENDLNRKRNGVPGEHNLIHRDESEIVILRDTQREERRQIEETETDRESDGEAKNLHPTSLFPVLSVYSMASQLAKLLTSLFNWLESDVLEE